MSGVIIRPTNDLGSMHPFAALADRPEQQQQVAQWIVRTVQRSFDADVNAYPEAQRASVRKRIQTDTEQKRRVQLAFEAMRDMRYHGYSLQRALDELYKALTARLEGRQTPLADPNRLWTPT